MTNASEQRIVEQLIGSKKILIITHRRPDADALGSMTAVWQWLNNGERQIDLHSCDPITVDSYSSIFGLTTTDLSLSLESIKATQYDTIVVLDCGSLSQAGLDEWQQEYKQKFPQTIVVNIDHHISNSYYGHLNYVFSNASSTCQLIFKIMRSQQQPINSFVATVLLSGIVADTGSFSNGATNLESLKISSELLQLGARHYQVSQAFLCNKETSMLKLWGIALSRLQLVSDYKIAYTYITKNELDEFGVSGSEGLSNFLNNLSDANIVMVLTEKDETTLKASLRTTKEDVDVMQIASIFGGGGHTKAAGFTVNGSLSTLNEIINKIIISLNKEN